MADYCVYSLAMLNWKYISREVFFLRLLLIALGFGWFISIFGVFMPWSAIGDQLIKLGAEEVFQDKMLVYWFRMCACGFTAIGIMSFIMAWNPLKYIPMIIFYGLFMILSGVVLLSHGLLMALDCFTIYFDFIFLIACGSGILLAVYLTKKSLKIKDLKSRSLPT